MTKDLIFAAVLLISVTLSVCSSACIQEENICSAADETIAGSSALQFGGQLQRVVSESWVEPLIELHVNPQEVWNGPVAKVVIMVGMVSLLMPNIFGRILPSDRGFDSALGAMFCFGVSDFLFTFAARSSTPSEMEAFTAMQMALMGAMGTIFSSVSAVIGQIRRDDDRHCIQQLEWINLALVVCSWCLVSTSQVAAVVGIFADPISGGPNLSILGTSAMLTSAFFYWYCGEIVNAWQLGGMVVSVVGMTVMSMTEAALSGIYWCIMASLLQALDAILLRVSMLKGASSVSVLSLQFLLWTLGGAVWIMARVPIVEAMGALHLHAYILVASAVLEMAGHVYAVRTFDAPHCLTGLNTAIFDSSCLVVSLLSRVTFADQPKWTVFCGMVLVLAGCSSIVLGDSLDEATDEAEDEVALASATDQGKREAPLLCQATAKIV